MSLVTSPQAANSHRFTACRNNLMVHLNHPLKLLFTNGDFRNAALYLFGNNSGALAEKCLDTAAALKKTAHSGQQRGFRRATSKRVWVTGVATNTVITLEGTGVGKPLATKPKRASKEMISRVRQQPDCISVCSKVKAFSSFRVPNTQTHHLRLSLTQWTCQ